MSDLPEGWEPVTLAELVGNGLFADGDWVESKDQDPSGDVRLTQLADVGDGHWRNRSNRFMTSAKATSLGCTFLKGGDLLIARMPDPLGRACIFPGDPKPAVTVVDVCVVRPGADGVNPRWLMHFLNAPQSRAAIAAHQSGTTRKRISRKNLGTIELPVPPLEEQGRIVERLDEALSVMDKGAADLSRSLGRLRQLRESVLAAAFSDPCSLGVAEVSGTEVHLEAIAAERHLRWIKSSTRPYVEPVAIEGSIPVPDSWASASLEAITDPLRPVSYGILKPGDDVQGGVPYVKVKNIRAGRIDVANLHRTTKEIAAGYRRSSLQEGDVLISIRGTYGRVAIVPGVLAGGNITQDSARLAPLPGILPEYLFWYLQSGPVQRHLQAIARGVAVKGVNIGDLRKLRVAFPDVDTQKQLVRAIETYMSVLDASEHAVESCLRRIGVLRTATMSAAFEGRLVEQRPSDEPASALLERLRSTTPSNRRHARKAKLSE